MSDSANNSSFENLDQARDQLREGIETSRELVRQTQVLIELTECDGVFAANDNNLAIRD